MLYLIVVLLIVLASLTVAIWAGTYFFQGYVYTEPSPGIFWQAPVVAGVLTLGYAVWCFSIAFSTGASPTNIPINTLVRFNPYEDMLNKPAPKLWAIKVDRRNKEAGDAKEESVLYLSKPAAYDKLHPGKRQYLDAETQKPWQVAGVIAIEIPAEGESGKMRFNLVETESGRLDLVDTKRMQYRQYATSDGWTMTEYEEGPSGLPTRFRWGRLLLNLFFNFAHLGAWFLGLWLVLRYQAWHALGFAAVMWVAMTLLFLPMMLGYAGEVSEARRSGPTAPTTPSSQLPRPENFPCAHALSHDTVPIAWILPARRTDNPKSRAGEPETLAREARVPG